ncbi:MAG: hypothetical protein LBV60_16140 [Streptomyces sp.]|jgi:hypothetical protein|nr:hypothetical protein [Streptomyces sp.]
MTDQPSLRDRIRRAICEASGFEWDPDWLEADEYGEQADAVLAVLPAPADRAAVPPSCDCEAEVHMGVGFYHHPWCATQRSADRAAVLREAIVRVEDPAERAKSSVGGGLGWEAARDVLSRMADEAQQAGEAGR